MVNAMDAENIERVRSADEIFDEFMGVDEFMRTPVIADTHDDVFGGAVSDEAHLDSNMVLTLLDLKTIKKQNRPENFFRKRAEITSRQDDIRERNIEKEKEINAENKVTSLVYQTKNKAKTIDKSELPHLHSAVRAIPNHIARSSLFAPVVRGNKRNFSDEVIVSRSDVTIHYSGKQLDEPQCDVWMQAMFLASKNKLGDKIEFCRSHFLSSIGRSTGDNDYEWLASAFAALNSAEISIKSTDEKLDQKLKLIDDYNIDGSQYYFQINKSWTEVYNAESISFIDFKSHLTLRDSSKYLNKLFKTDSANKQTHTIDTLKEKMQYMGRKGDFKTSLKKSLEELTEKKLISKWNFGVSQKGREHIVIYKK